MLIGQNSLSIRNWLLAAVVVFLAAGCGRQDGLCPVKGWTSFTTEEGLEEDWLRSLEVDEEGSLWVGDISGNLAVFDGQAWSMEGMALSSTGHSVNDLELGLEGDMWAAFQSGIIAAVMDVRTRSFNLREEHGDLAVYDLAVDGNGNPFASTSKGLLHHYLGGWKLIPPPNEHRQFSLKSVLVDADERVWVGAKYGLFKYRDGKWVEFHRAAGQDILDVVSMDVSPAGDLWLGTSFGVFRFTGDDWTYYSEKDGLPSSRIQVLAVGPEGLVWAGTPEGAAMYRDQSWVIFSTEDGLVDKRVTDIAFTSDGAVWFATQGGLSCFRERR